MSFLTKKISTEDIDKYHLKEISKKFSIREINEWTIDRGRDIYLLLISFNWQDSTESAHYFCWKGVGTRIDIRTVSFVTDPHGTKHDTMEIVPSAFPRPNGCPFWLPAELEVHRPQITQDFKEALQAYGDAGVSDARKFSGYLSSKSSGREGLQEEKIAPPKYLAHFLF